MPTTEFSDNFNRTNGDSLGSNWNEALGDMDIASNQLLVSTGGSDAVVTQALTHTDQFAQITLVNIESTTRPLLILRAASTAFATGYGANFRTGNSDVIFYRKVAGSYTNISDGPDTITYVEGDVLRFECETVAGDVALRAYQNGNLVHSFTDSDGAKLTTGSYAGIRESVANTIFDDFSMGILADGTTTSTTTSTSTSTSSSTSTTIGETTTSTTTTLASDGGLAFGEQTPLNGETAVSWATWGGTGEVVGDPNWGKLGLDIGENGYSRVYDFGNENERTITITHNLYGTGQGTATTEIRGQAASFLVADGTPTWEAYSTPVAKTWRFIQVRLVKS